MEEEQEVRREGRGNGAHKRAEARVVQRRVRKNGGPEGLIGTLDEGWAPIAGRREVPAMEPPLERGTEAASHCEVVKCIALS